MSTALAMRKEPHISATQLTTWLQCPRKYRFQYLDRLPWPSVPSALVFGTAVHVAIAELYQARLEGRDVSLDEVHAVYRVAWAAEAKPIDSKEGETSEGLDAMARALIGVALEQPQRGRIIAVEEPFRIVLADDVPPMIGVIDRIEEHDGRAVIVEIKTAAMRFTDQRVADDIQPTVYALAAVEMDLPGIASIDDVEVRYDVLLKLKKPALDERPTRRSARQAEELREVASMVWAAREAGIFPPNRGWQCAGCPFEEICRK